MFKSAPFDDLNVHRITQLFILFLRFCIGILNNIYLVIYNTSTSQVL